MRAGAGTEFAKHATAQIIFVALQYACGFTVGVGYFFRYYANRMIRAIEFANAAGYTFMLVVFDVYQRQFAAKTVDNLERFPVFGITFRRFFTEKYTQCGFHAHQQRPQSVEKSF
jgi:hypothetical protein